MFQQNIWIQLKKKWPEKQTSTMNLDLFVLHLSYWVTEDSKCLTLEQSLSQNKYI